MSGKLKTKGKARNAARAKAAQARKAAGEPPRVEIIKGMLLRPEGTTVKEVLAVTGWPTVSMPQQARAAGLDLRKEKLDGQPTRYFGTIAAA